jgi:uncharacterized membrane-anchored protein YitT (DUF2179 family)
MTRLNLPDVTASESEINAHSRNNGRTTASSIIKSTPKRTWITRRKLWYEIRRALLITLGAVLAALGYSLFQIPYNIAAGGIGGISIIINHFTGWSEGTLYFVLNIPLLVLGFFYLGRWLFVVRTIAAVIIFSVATNIFLAYLPLWLDEYPLTNDILLSAVYGGLVGGVAGGLIYRAGSTMGGTGIIGRIIQKKTGVPLSQVYLYTDGGIVLAAGAIFGWEIALYALLTLFLNGMASDYTLEGPSSVRTATIITNRAEEMAQALMQNLGHGISQWKITGGYTGEARAMLSCTIYRPQVNDLKRIVAGVDPDAFVTIGVTHQALGSKFLPLNKSQI